MRGAYLLDLEVVEIRQFAADVRSLAMGSSDLVDFEFRPGQGLMVEIPAVTGRIAGDNPSGTPIPTPVRRAAGPSSPRVMVWQLDGRGGGRRKPPRGHRTLHRRGSCRKAVTATA